jgi:hypothetical protein
MKYSLVSYIMRGIGKADRGYLLVHASAGSRYDALKRGLNGVSLKLFMLLSTYPFFSLAGYSNGETPSSADTSAKNLSKPDSAFSGIVKIFFVLN